MKKRGKKKHRPGKIKWVKSLRKMAFIKQSGLCYWCNREMIWKTSENAQFVWDSPFVCTADHLVQKSIGGRTTPENIVAACRLCNNRRHAPPAEIAA
jgi:5-methylcytosine-specific restriction endonuclease McrA